MKLLILLAFTNLLLAGCSTYSKSECQDFDWYAEGKKAALDGYTAKQAKTHFIDKCHEDKGVGMDPVDFDNGFKSGLNKLCTPQGRKTLEDRDIKYQGTCESFEDEQGFKKARTRELEEKNHELEREIARLKAENEKLQKSCPATDP